MDARPGAPRRRDRSRRDLRDDAALGRGRASVAGRCARPRAHAAGRVYRRERRTLLPPLRFGLAVAQAPVAPRLRVRHRPHGLVPVLPAPRGERDRASPQVRARRQLDRGLDEGLLAPLRGSARSGRSAGSCKRACVLLPHTAFCFSRLHAERLVAAGYSGDAGSPSGSLRRSASRPSSTSTSTRSSSCTPDDTCRRSAIDHRRARVRPAREAASRGPPRALRRRPRAGAPARGSPTSSGCPRLVRLRGRRPEDEVDEAIARAACLVTASEREGYGLVVVEAAARGTPSVVVAGPENAATELVEDGVNGVVSPDASPESLAAALERVRRGGFGAPGIHGTLVRRERADAPDRPLARARRRELRARLKPRGSRRWRSHRSGRPPFRPVRESRRASAGRRRRSPPPGTRARRRPSGPPRGSPPPCERAARGSRNRPASPRTRRSWVARGGTARRSAGSGRSTTSSVSAASPRSSRARNSTRASDRRGPLLLSVEQALRAAGTRWRCARCTQATTTAAGDHHEPLRGVAATPPDQHHEREAEVVDGAPILERHVEPPELPDEHAREPSAATCEERAVSPQVAAREQHEDAQPPRARGTPASSTRRTSRDSASRARRGDS